MQQGSTTNQPVSNLSLKDFRSDSRSKQTTPLQTLKFCSFPHILPVTFPSFLFLLSYFPACKDRRLARIHLCQTWSLCQALTHLLCLSWG